MKSSESCCPEKTANPLLTRRTWLSRVLKALIGWGLFRVSLQVDSALAASPLITPVVRRPTIGETFSNEVMKFVAGFLFFHHAGDAEISLVPMEHKGKFQATLTGRTRGIIGFLTRYRKDTHISELIENEDHTRFICTRLIRDTKIGHHHTTKVFEMDYVNRRLTVTRLKKNRKSVHVKPIPKGVYYDDPLTAFYNFRFGSYGPIKFGKTYRIRTIPGKKLNTITLKVASRAKTIKEAKHLPIRGKATYLVYSLIRIS